MLYYCNHKTLSFDADDSICIIHNEQKYFAWLVEILKPEHAKYLEHIDDGYNANSDEERSWHDLGEVEQAWLEDVFKSAANGGSSVEVSQFDTKSRLPEIYDFGIDYHYAVSANDLPADFEKENREHWPEFYFWKDGHVMPEPENEDEPGNLIEVFTL